MNYTYWLCIIVAVSCIVVALFVAKRARDKTRRRVPGMKFRHVILMSMLSSLVTLHVNSGCRPDLILPPVPQTSVCKVLVDVPKPNTPEPNEPYGIVTIREMRLRGEEPEVTIKTKKVKTTAEIEEDSKAIERWLQEQKAEEAKEEIRWKARLRERANKWRVVDMTISDLGMRRAQALEKFGHPTSRSRSVGSWGVHEQWVYRLSDYNTYYLYFDNGILTSWQD